MRTVAASATKLTAGFLWLCVWCLAQSQPAKLHDPNLPNSLTCDIGHYEKLRLEMWEFYSIAHFSDKPDERKWISEHDSVDSAMKACKKVLKAQEKIWKDDLKGKKK